MSIMSVTLPTQPIKHWLDHFRGVAIERLVNRARLELSDYQRREITELTPALARIYDNWCETIVKNDFGHSQALSRQTVQENLALGCEPAQISRLPWLIYDVAIEILEGLSDRIDTIEQLQFTRRAHKLTCLMVTIGQLQIASSIVEQATYVHRAC